LIYQFAGIAPERYRAKIRETALSFRPLTADELASIRETRLRIVSARTGETLAQLSKRTRNKWDPKTTAVINGVKVDQPLKEGQLIKIGVPQRYRSR
jgi:predicted Zn-dependent protease